MTEFRYTDREPPAYRHVPGRTPHPTRDPEGHSYGQSEEKMPDLNDFDWRTCEPYLYGIDLFNAGYWWECHEVLEALWHAAEIGTPAAHVLQAVIQCAAAHLKIVCGQPNGARRLLEHAHQHVLWGHERHLGLDLQAMLEDTDANVQGRTEQPVGLILEF
ncbi:MAG: DUF309 domain-containing protein [bacterium]|nr:DUF309 domain-containing protein [bacterium]